ncbi:MULTISPECIES: branched-chain amino acid ABC transporter permease [Achromobacter]|jgi:branched-chain amino acid transport system permease protein|uniref:Branched-chain amino acid ABC transporter permease n=1 Tax=Achromobacter aegrifaciens TaxID=1287736 RepID=A0AAD2KL21_ACHAE|nr:MULTISPECIES: branched-chain amino acid ABC transporter permease [Achromobacter]MBD9379618.1 branched-chain amino acid ABC transporter permease [Achromobacter sp. ACM02]MBD9417988.1 branched-chain amino acid ABC transporter permease [Achromobacter sp. ACM04]MBD9428383.1 branched-chain amino acid ABC transporter permease [Achromobacter sp. ACM03]MDQ1763487.1 branched-chain amino acid ABC transporter permease [Achromobacter aegrifaciens]MDR7947396.1 branched-chain amino acid ABC transporter p
MSTVIIGLSLGMLLFLLASGLTLIFGMLGVINFAHGALYMLGAYLAFDIQLRTGSFIAGLVVATVGVGLVGVAMERLALRPLYNRPHFYQLILTFGFILVISEAVKFVWGLGYQETPMPALLAGTVELAGSTIPVYRLFVIVFGLLVSAALFFVLEKSTFGMLVRAASSDGEMVRILGLPAATIRSAVFGVGAALAGLAGAISAPLFPIELGMATNTIIDCFIVVILGGLGNIRGVVAASLLIGMVRAVGYTFMPSWVDILTFAMLIATLLTRPQGLFSRQARLA